ncbi:Lipopolysaccharide export system protein LptC [Gammaproteobacteria bacterium]
MQDFINKFNIYRFSAFIKGLFLIIVAAFSTWVTQTSAPQVDTPESPPRHDPDYFAINFIATIMDTTGKPHYRLQSNYIEHFMDDNSTELHKPNFILFQKGMPSWLLSAERGRVSAKGETVWLLDQVRLRRPDELEPLELNTSEMKLHPKQQYGETDHAIEIRRWRQVVNAVGMRADLKEKRLEFLSQVRGSYDVGFSNHK